MGTTRTGGIFIGFEADANDFGGGNRVNRLCAEVLRGDFEEVPSLSGAVVQVHSFNWKAPTSPQRVFIDHGSFADASFWAYVAPTLRRSDTIIVSSTVCARVAERFIDSAEPLVLTVPFSVDVGLFRPASNRDLTRRAVAQAIGIPLDGPWLLVVAGFVRRKNHHLAIRFMHALQQRIPEVRLVVVGSTPNRPSSLAFRAAVENLVNTCGAAPRVHFLPHLPQSRLSDLMAAADLLVHFTNCRLENFGLVVAEAMAAGLPVVAADWGGLRDLVVPGRTGFLARTYLTRLGPRTDWQSVVRPACHLLQNRAAWLEFSREARSYAEQHLSDVSFRSRFGAAVATAMTRRVENDGSPPFTSAGTDLRIRTIGLNALHPEIRDAGDEYRLLMRTDEGRHYRLLTGPAASSESPPSVGPQDRLYPLVDYKEDAAGIRVDDPAWPAVIAADPARLEVLRASDGKKTLKELWVGQAAASGTTADVLHYAAQALVDEGLLCPIEDALDPGPG